MKKILHIQVFPKLSGVQKVSLEILKSLPSSEYEKHIIFSDYLDAGDKLECQRAFENAGVKVHYLPSLKREIGFSDFRATRDLYRFIRKNKFDIVHTNSTKPGIIGRFAAWIAKTPLVIHTVHGLSFHKFIKFPKWQFYWMCEMMASFFCDKICVVNKYYLRYFKFFKRKTETIYNGVDFSEFPLLERPKKDKDNIVRILSVGRLDTAKDPLTLLQAAKIVIDKNSNVHFTFVGDGEYLSQCKKYIKDNNLQEYITLAGWQKNVSEYYSTHDIFANSSIYEAFGLMFVEAGRYSLPSITTTVEGIPEVVQDKITGLLSPPKNPDALAENILKLINDSELRSKMGQKAKEFVETNFSSQLMANKYQNIYNSF